MLTLVIPLHNEEHSLSRLLHELARLRVSLDGALHVVMVDDGSTDATRAILGTLGKQPWISVVCTPKRQGQHRALFRGIEAALLLDGVQRVGTMDADMDPPPDAFLTLLPYAANHDLVISRRMKRSRSTVRKVVSLLLLVFSWLLRPTGIRDHGSMFRLYGVELCRRCLRLRAHGEFLSGVSLLAADDPVEVPVRYDAHRARASRYSPRTVCDAGIQMVRLLARHPFGLIGRPD